MSVKKNNVCQGGIMWVTGNNVCQEDYLFLILRCKTSALCIMKYKERGISNGEFIMITYSQATGRAFLSNTTAS